MRFNGTNLRRLSCLAFAALLAASCQNPTEPGSGEASVLLNATLMQEDRFGLPAIATVFIPTAERDAYNQGTPATDRANYTDEVVARLTAFGHPDPAALAAALLPDMQPINTSLPTAFLNGRRLQDDVITAELGLIFGSNAALNDDHVDANDQPFLATFPYLAPLTP